MVRTRDVIGIGIVGLGGAAQQMAPSLLADERVAIRAGADPNRDVREEFSAAFDCRVYETCEEMAADPAVDCVYVASPHQWHMNNAITAAQHGKHVIVEKPMALTADACTRMIKAAEENGVVLIVGHTHSFGKPIRKVREMLLARELGRLSMINSFAYTNFLYKPRRPEELDTSRGGGVLFNQLPHHVDIVRYIGGEVCCVRGMTSCMDPTRPTEGAYMAYLDLECGAAASIVYSGYDYFDSDEFHSWIGELGNQREPGGHASARRALGAIAAGPAGTRARKRSWSEVRQAAGRSPISGHPHFGVTIVSCERGDIRFSARGVLVYSAQGIREVDCALSDAYPDKSGVIEELVDAVVHGVPPIHDGAWGRATMEVCLALRDAAESRGEVRLRVS